MKKKVIFTFYNGKKSAPILMDLHTFSKLVFKDCVVGFSIVEADA